MTGPAPAAAGAPDTAFDRVCAALEARGLIVRRRGQQAMAQCPSHEDRAPSLSISRGDRVDGVLLNCQAGCLQESVLGALGLQVSDLFDRPREKRTGGRAPVVASYRYVDEAGQLLYVKERREPKAFSQWRPKPGGGRDYSLGDVRRVMYRLPQLVQAIQAGRTVYLAEGEKDADALAAAGVEATTWSDGAWQEGARTKWRPEYTAAMAGAEVVIVRDRDAAGRQTAQDIAGRLTGVAASVRIVEAAEGKDAADHLAAGRGVDDLVDVELPLAAGAVHQLRSGPVTLVSAVEDESWRLGLEALPAGYRIPEGYEVDHEGVWALKESREGIPMRLPVASAPVVVTRVFVDPEGLQLVELAWLDRRQWVSRTVPRSVVKSGRRLVTTLGDAGLPATEADARSVERWLARVEQHNREVIPRDRLARWLGWQDDGVFVRGQDDPRHVEPTYPEQAGALAAHHRRGSFERWQAAVADLDPFPVAVVVLSAAFAPVLLEVLGLDSFTVDVSGRSTRGKTTAAKLALSAWADPTERADGIFSWRTTMLAAEKRLNLVRGMCVVLDETRVVKSPELVDQVLYQVPKNHGQARGGGWPSLLPWRTVVISTGEQSALSFTTHQGAGARVLTVARPPFPPGGHDVGAIAARTGELVSEHYGHAGPAFAENVRQMLAAGGKAELRRRHAALIAEHQGSSDLSGRRAPMLASLILAAQLAHEWGVVPVPAPPPELWAELFHAEDATDDRPEMALDVVREFVGSFSGSLWRPGSYPQPPSSGWIGRHLTVEGKATVGLLPERLRTALGNAGYVLDAVLPGWQETGALVRSGAGHSPWTSSHRLDSSKARLYVFAPGVIEMGDEDGGTDEP